MAESEKTSGEREIQNLNSTKEVNSDLQPGGSSMEVNKLSHQNSESVIPIDED